MRKEMNMNNEKKETWDMRGSIAMLEVSPLLTMLQTLKSVEIAGDFLN